MENFELWFPDATMTRDQKMSVYESILKKLKDDGFLESHKILDIEYRQFKYEQGGWYERYIVNTLQRWWWNYGYNPERVLVWSAVFCWPFSSAT